MDSIAIITWNMRGATMDGDTKKKIDHLKQMAENSKRDYESEFMPAFLLQEAGNLAQLLEQDTWWTANYTWCFSPPIGAFHNRCTTGLMVPSAYRRTVEFDTNSQPSDTRSYVTAGIDLNGTEVLLGSIHAVASGAAAEDGRYFLKKCAAYEHFVCGGDFNCPPQLMDSQEQFTQRQRDKGMDYSVHITNDPTHFSSDGKGRVLDYICVKGACVGRNVVICNSSKRTESSYSDHCPVYYEVYVD